MGVAVTAVVLSLEICEQVPGKRKIEFVSLASVAEVDTALIANFSLPAFLLKIYRSLFLQRCELLQQTCLRDLASRAH